MRQTHATTSFSALTTLSGRLLPTVGGTVAVLSVDCCSHCIGTVGGTVARLSKWTVSGHSTRVADAVWDCRPSGAVGRTLVFKVEFIKNAFLRESHAAELRRLYDFYNWLSFETALLARLENSCYTLLSTLRTKRRGEYPVCKLASPTGFSPHRTT